MYNFRYHLVTIVSIFAALAIGLLLGVAITGSDLLRNTSDDLVASLQNQYTVLRQDNSSISESLKFEQGTSSFFFDDWRKERMNGRVIVLLSENNKTELDTQDSLASLVMSSGGAVVKVKVLVPNFGLDDPDTFAALKLLVTGLGNDNASQQLASALLTEWSYSGKVQTLPVSSNNPTDTSADPGAQADVQAGGNAGLINANNLPDQYPLTSYLVKQKIISIEVDYSSITALQEKLLDKGQLALFEAAGSKQLPYAANGMINIALQRSDAEVTLDDSALALAETFKVAGEAGKLPYLFDLSGVDTELGSTNQSSAGGSSDPSYFSVVALDPSALNDLPEQIRGRGLPCVTDPSGTAGQYSILALLSGGQNDVYGRSRVQDLNFPPMPVDKSGLAIFKKPTS